MQAIPVVSKYSFAKCPICKKKCIIDTYSICIPYIYHYVYIPLLDALFAKIVSYCAACKDKVWEAEEF